MSTATKTILFGTHNFILHPIFVFIAWLIRYHAIPNLSEFIAICVHDLGLFGLPNIDGAEGEQHPRIISNKVQKLALWFWKKAHSRFCLARSFFIKSNVVLLDSIPIIEGHSRFFCMQTGRKLSKLFQADKLAVGLYPFWLYLILGTLSGEISEYMQRAENGKYQNSGQFGYVDKLTWFLDLKSRLTIMGLDRNVEKYLENANHWQK